jgi:hypothetical protein
MRQRVRYIGKEGRATGQLSKALVPRGWLDMAESILGRAVDLVVFQGYRNGAAVCASHVDDYDQVILSLGATRTMQIGDTTRQVDHGSLTHLPIGTPHAILPDQTEEGERISLVFRARSLQ